MLRFFTKLLLLALLMGALFALLEGQARRMYRDGTDLFHKAKSLAAAPARDRTRALILGPSHAESAIDPAALSVPAFNLAFPSQDLYYDHQLFAREAGKLKALRCVVQVLTYFCFDFRTDSLNMHDVREYMMNFGIPPRDGMNARIVLDLSVYLRHRATFLSHLWTGKEAQPFRVLDASRVPPELEGQGEWLLDTGYRWSAIKTDYAHLAQVCPDRIAQHVQRHSAQHINEPLLRATLEDAQKAKLGVLLLQTPYAPAYRENYPAGLKTEFHEILGRVLADFPAAKYVDDSESPEFGEEDFADCDHLNARGAEKFTRLIAPALEACTAEATPP